MTDDHCITFLKKLTGIDVDLANPLPVLNWMREHMPEEWEEYLLHIFSTTWTLKLSDDLFRILDLRNLVDYLYEHPSWGEKEECEQCRGTGEQYDYRNAWVCEVCFGTGKLIHPALQYLRKVKG